MWFLQEHDIKTIIDYVNCIYFLFFVGSLQHLRSYRKGAWSYQWYLTNVLPYRNTMPQIQNITPTASQYTETELACSFAIHWCGSSHWNTQLPILMSDQIEESFLDWHTQRTLNFMMLLWLQSIRSSVESVLYPQSREPGTCGMLINDEQIITNHPIDVAMGSLGGGPVSKLSAVCLHNNAIVAMASWLLHCIVGHPNPTSAPSILLVLLEPHCTIHWATAASSNYIYIS